MKKYLLIAVFGMALLASSKPVYAANHISKIATTKGGRHVARCAQKMDKGVSQCVQLTQCIKEM